MDHKDEVKAAGKATANFAYNRKDDIKEFYGNHKE